MIYDQHSRHKELLGEIDVDRTDDNEAEGVLSLPFFFFLLFLGLFISIDI